MKAIKLPDQFARSPYQVEYFDDFHWFVTAHFWTAIDADDNNVAPAVGDAGNGILSMGAGTDDNEEVGVRSTAEILKFQADLAFIGEWKIQYAEAATSAANVCIGLADAAGADLISDNGGALNINSSGVCIYKLDGGTVWRAGCKTNSITKDTVSIQTAGGSAYQTLRIIGRAIDGTSMEFTYFCDGQPLTDSNNRPIKHTLAYASATEMRWVAGYLKAGSTSVETLLVDYAYLAHTRI